MIILEQRAVNYLRRLNLPDIPLNGMRLKEESVFASQIMADFAKQIQQEMPIEEKLPLLR